MQGVLAAEPTLYNRNWHPVFQRDNPIHIEIGMGKGEFLTTMAANHPEIDFVGIERTLTIMHIAAMKYQRNPLPNLRLLPADAVELELYFQPAQVERIYLNFSDPWPKQKHKERRLTAREKLAVYRRILKPGGQIHFKTDQESLFDFSLRELIREGWSAGKITRDLHRSSFEGNVLTEYERRFAGLGQPIYRLVAWRAFDEE